MIAKRWWAFWVSCATAVIAAVSGYDAFSSQFEWQKIPRLWMTTIAVVPLWSWVAIGQSILIAWLFWDRRRQRLTVDPTIYLEPVADTDSDRKLDNLSKRINLSQDHINNLLDRADQFDLGLTILNKAEAMITDLNGSTSVHDTLLTGIAADLKSMKIHLGKLSMTAASIIILIADTEPIKLLRTILRQMDALADSTYGGSISPLSNPAFVTHSVSFEKFESLASLAENIVTIQELPINIPCDAGLYWFSPPNPGIPEFSQDRHDDPDLQRIMRLRCDHHLIRQYVNAVTPDHVENDGSVHR